MSSITAALAHGMNPNRLACAAHEVGHAVAFHHAGIPVRRLRIRPGRNDGWAGQCDPAVDQIPLSQVPGWQIGLMAGEAAVYRFLRCHLANRHADAWEIAETGARHDLADFRRYRSKGLSLTAARKQATALIDRHGGRIDRLTLRLAAAKHLPGSAL